MLPKCYLLLSLFVCELVKEGFIYVYFCGPYLIIIAWHCAYIYVTGSGKKKLSVLFIYGEHIVFLDTCLLG